MCIIWMLPTTAENADQSLQVALIADGLTANAIPPYIFTVNYFIMSPVDVFNMTTGYLREWIQAANVKNIFQLS